MTTNHVTGADVERLRELIVIAQARAGWSEEWNVELNVLACRVGPVLFGVLAKALDFRAANIAFLSALSAGRDTGELVDAQNEAVRQLWLALDGVR